MNGMPRSLAFVLCLLALMAAAPAGARAANADVLLADAQAALDAQDYARALTLAEKAVAALPASSEAHRMRANARRASKDAQGALADYDRALQLDARNHRALAGRAATRLLLKDLDQALEDANRAIALRSDYAAGLSIRADVLIARKQFPEAIRDLDESLRLNPKNPHALLSRGNARYALRDYRRAIEDYDACERLDGKLLAVHYNRGLARQALGDAGAERDFTRAIELGHRTAEAYARRGGVRLDRGDVTGREDLTKALALDPKVEYARRRLAESGAPRVVAGAATGQSGPIPGLSKFPDLPRPAGELWVKPSTALVALPEDGPALQLSAPDPGPATRALPLADISVSMAALRELAGPLSPDQEKAWVRKWQPFFDYPHPEALNYFRALNPLLQELQGVRGVVHQAAQDFDGAWAEAVVSHAAGDVEGAETALGEAQRHAHVLKSATARLAKIQKQAQALGNPPNPHEAKAKAKAWSKKWSSPGPSPSHIAWLWRLMQRYHANKSEMETSRAKPQYELAKCENARLAQQRRFYDGRKAPEPPPCVPPKWDPPPQVWPADEATWSRWFEGGERGPEPTTDKRYSLAVEDKGWLLLKEWAVHVGPYAPGEKLVVEQVSPREAARSIAAGKKVVIYGRQPTSNAGAQQPASPPPAAVTAAPAKAPAPSPEEQARQAAEQRAKQEAIAEKEALIKLVQKNLARDEAEWRREKDPKRKEELYLRVLNNQSAIQHEQDLIQTLRTGEYVHTRTPSDQYTHDLMIVRGVEQMERVGEARRVAAAVEKMAAKAEPDQVQQLRDFVARQLTQTDLAQGNVEKARQVAQAVFNTTQGRREQAAAQHLEEALTYQDYESRAEKVKFRAGLTLLLTGMAAPAYAAGAGTVVSVGGTSAEALTAVSAGYGATTGTIEGGPLEGIKQAVAATGVPGLVASEMMTGYQRGGLVSQGGVAGALERGAEAFLAGKVVESVAGKVGAWYAERAKRGITPPAPALKPGMTFAQMIESQTFQTAKRQAQQQIKRYRSVVEEIAQAKAAGATAARLAELEARRAEQAMAMNENFLAKRILKADGKAGRAGKGAAADAELEKDFAQAVEHLYATKVDPAFKATVKQANVHWRKKTPGGKWEPAGEVEFREFRQGASGKTANTDRDLGLIERRNQEGEIYQLYRGDKPIKLSDAEQELQRLYEIAYQRAGGGDPRLAMQHITTSGGLESYKDLIYTQLNNPENVARINRGWAAQSAEVLQNKVTHAGTGTGEFAALFKKIDGANQAAKDIEQRLLPLLKATQAKATGQKAFEVGQDMDRWRAIQRALSSVETDPVAASQQLRVLTGLDSIGEVSELTGKAFVGAAKLQ